jgi:membrane associated rhomboid family serine protease
MCWLVFLINNVFWNGHLISHGILPRHFSSLPGIIWAPFLHSSFQHLTANTLPLLILGGIICARSRNQFMAVTVAGIIMGGGLTWLFGRRAFHVGASGLIFCYFGYLISRAWFDRKILSFCVSILCLIGYGGILKGILPTSAAVSWEGHLAGLISGVAVAWLGSRAYKAEATAPLARLDKGAI